ncbi:MAG: stalk domain-containing protein, partial [Desulfocucumaceae bacterium]
DLINNTYKYYLIDGRYVMTQGGFVRLLHIGNDFNVYAVVANGGLMAVGSSGSVMTYPGSVWAEPCIVGGLSNIFFENGEFVFLGAGNIKATSLDGEKWTLQVGGEKSNIKGIVTNGMLQAKIGSNGVILTSSDGVIWTQAQLPENTGKVKAIACGNGKFVAVTEDKKVIVALDGVKWGTVNTDSRPNFKPTGIVFGEGIFAAGSGDSVFTSENGLMWEELPGFRCEAGLMDIAYGNGLFMVAHAKGYIMACPASVIKESIKQKGQRREIINQARTVIIALDGRKYIPIKVPVLMVNDRLMLPLREVLETLGANVLWDEARQSVIVIRGQALVSLRVGDNKAFINGNVVSINPAPELFSERTMVPVRFISEALGASVDWDESKYSLKITTK